MREERGGAATLRALTAPSSLILMAMGLAGCVSGTNGLASLAPAPQTRTASASPAAQSATALVDPAGAATPGAARDPSHSATPATTDSASVGALALAEAQPTSPALTAAQTMIADTGERVGIPAQSPKDQPAAAAARDASKNATSLETTGTIAMRAEAPAGAPAGASAATQTSASASASTSQAAEPASPLARLFASNQVGRAEATRAAAQPARTGTTQVAAQAAAQAAESQPIIPLASDDATDEPDEPDSTAGLQVASAANDSALPGVELHSLYEAPERSGRLGAAERAGQIQLASAAGSARLAPGFLLKQSDTVQTACLKPPLLGLLKMVEYHFGKQVIITSGYRGAAHNAAVGGVRHSEHMKCEAADIQVPGASKWEVARYVRSLPGRGGVGTYCHTDSVHVDIGEERDWNWRCRRGR